MRTVSHSERLPAWSWERSRPAVYDASVAEHGGEMQLSCVLIRHFENRLVPHLLLMILGFLLHGTTGRWTRHKANVLATMTEE